MISMANLKYGETHITNITQLCGSGTWSLPTPEVVDPTQNCIICIDNDLDFNDEGFYYHNDNFLGITLPEISVTNSVIFDGQNHTLTNIYLLSQKSFFYIVTSNSNYSSLIIQNATFEIVLNSFSRMITITSNAGGAYHSIFKNCIFNIKSIADLDCIFYRKYNSSSNISFINCIFNIECNLISNFKICLADATGNGIIDIESCEFRLKILHANPNCTITLVYNNASGNSSKNTNFNNSLVFVNNYSNELVTIKLVHDTNTYSWGSDTYKKSFTNNFISAFDGVSAEENKVSLDIDVAKNSTTTLSSSFFIDTDCVSISSHLQELADTTYPGMINLIPLTTAESKSPTEMAAKGYVFAQE